MFGDFWAKQGVPGYQISYKRFSLHEPLDLDGISADTTTLGLVCNDLDDIMHGSLLGNNQLKMSTEQWIMKSKIVESISALKSKGFHVYITADHGNVEAIGLKNLTLKDKVGALSRGKRHLHFTNELLLQGFIEQNPSLEVGKKVFLFTLENKRHLQSRTAR